MKLFLFKINVFILVIFFLLVNSNCMTFISTFQWKEKSKPRIYSGTITEMETMAEDQSGYIIRIPFLLMLVDLPLSFTADTFLLPLSIPMAIYYNDWDEEFSKSRIKNEVQRKRELRDENKKEFFRRNPIYAILLKQIQNNDISGIKDSLHKINLINILNEILDLQTKEVISQYDDNLNAIRLAQQLADEQIQELILDSVKADTKLEKLFYKEALIAERLTETVYKSEIIWKEPLFSKYTLNKNNPNNIFEEIKAHSNYVFYPELASQLIQHPKAVKMLLQNFSNLSSQELSFLVEAAVKEKITESLILLLNKVNKKHLSFRSEYTLSTIVSDITLLELFLKKGLNPNTIFTFYSGGWDHDDLTLLVVSIQENRLDSFYILLKKGANPNLSAKDGYNISTPVEIAIYRNYEENKVVRYQMIKELIRAGADIKKKDEYGNNPVVSLAKYHKLNDVLELLESYGVK